MKALINKLAEALKKYFLQRWKENNRIKKIERKAFLGEREKAAVEIGKQKARRDPYERIRL